ncbi:MAG TPA: hypothetical protein VHD14_17290 [Pseudolabrys sp.]|nr:hypothetical protein [Pseudolabrys sp.]
MPTISRRTFAALGAAATLIPAAPAIASNSEFDRLWSRYVELLSARQRICAAIDSPADRKTLHRLEREYDENYEARLSIENSIRALPPTVNAAAALLIIDLDRLGDAAAEDGEGQSLDVLAHVRAGLTGQIRRQVDAIIDGAGERPIDELLLAA